MKRISMTNCLLCAVIALYLGGCAKSELVRKDDASAPVSSATPLDMKTDVVGKQVPAQSVQNQPVVSDAPAAGQTAVITAQHDRLQKALGSIYFTFDSSELTPDARSILQKNAGLLKASARDSITIEGHCDERGSAEYNLALGERRALAAQKYLVTLGVPEHLLSTISYGEEKPIDQGHAEDAWAKNRRDEFVVKTGQTSH